MFAQVSLAADYTIQKPFLYKIEKAGKVSYLFGSMHAGLPLNSFPESLSELLHSARVVAFEYDPDLLDQKVKARGPSVRNLPEGQTLRDLLSAKAIDKLEDMLGSEVLRQAMNLKLDPLSGILGRRMADAISKLDGISWKNADGIDYKLMKMAKAEGKQTVFVDRSADIFAVDTEPKDLEDLLAKEDPFYFIGRCLADGRNRYVEGNEASFDRNEQICSTRLGVIHGRERTASWIPELSEIFEAGNAFAVVGVAHVVGPAGLIKLLRAKDFSVTREINP